MIDLKNRFVNICDWDKNPLRVTIVGAGSIGSNLALLLARLGVGDITIYDDDVVEDHNLGHQAFRVKDIGSTKVSALQEIIREATGVEIDVVEGKTDGKVINTDILVLAVDSMQARKEIATNSSFMYIVDGRMGGETLNVYATFRKDKYLETLYSDEEASEAPCGGKSIGYISYLIAALMEIVIKKMINEEEFPSEQNFCALNLIYQHN